MSLLDSASAALGLGDCDSVEVALSRSDEALTRFAGSRIHQNVARTDDRARVRVVVDGRHIGVASTSSLDPRDVLAAAEQAREIARTAPADPAYPGPAPADQTYAAPGEPDAATAQCDPAERARLVAAMLAELPAGVEGAGYVQTSSHQSAFASSTGIAVTDAGSYAIADLLAAGPDSTGHAEAAHRSVGMLDAAVIGARAARGVQLGTDVRDVAPGSWPVVLEPGASAVMIDLLAAMAFSAKDFLDGQSAFSGHLGEQVCSPLITIADEPQSALLPGARFDGEGTATGRLALIDHGVAAAVVHDRATAARAGAVSTGNALSPPNPWGPQPGHLLLAGGDQSLADLVAGCERGLYVTRFHYGNVVHPVQSSITGMTRNGTFLIEEGRLVGAVRDMRFTQSVLAALSTVDGVGRDVEVISDAFSGSVAAPALRLGAFTFTSGTA